MTKYRWGILGTGNIAGAMAEALGEVPGAHLQAVASRRQETADAFARRWSVSAAHGSYHAIFADPAVDIVYVATPNAVHKENILAALAAGKHVLCEKPLTLTPEDSALCAETARKAGLFLMEAMWTAFLPALRKAADLVAEGAIGTPHHLTANFVSHRDPTRFPNLFDPALGGGASLDLGIYPIAVARLLAGPVASARAERVIGPSGVDEMVSMILRHETSVLSHLSFGFRLDMPIGLWLWGNGGRLEISDDFHRADHVIVENGKGRRRYDLPPIGAGYAHEAMEVQSAIAMGQIQSKIWPLSDAIECARLVELARTG